MESAPTPATWPFGRVAAVIVLGISALTTATMLCSTTLVRTETSREMGPLVTLSLAISSAVACGITGLYAIRYSQPARRRQAGRGCLGYILGGFLGTIVAVAQLFVVAEALPQLSGRLYLATAPLGAAIGGTLAMAISYRSGTGREDAPASEPPGGPEAAG